MFVIVRQRRRPTLVAQRTFAFRAGGATRSAPQKKAGDSRTAPASYFGSWVTPARAPYGESRAGAGAVPLGEHQTNDGKSERLLTNLPCHYVADRYLVVFVYQCERHRAPLEPHASAAFWLEMTIASSKDGEPIDSSTAPASKSRKSFSRGLTEHRSACARRYPHDNREE